MPPSPSLGCFQFWRREVFLWATNQIRLGHVFGDPGQLRENHLPMFTTDMISKSAEREPCSCVHKRYDFQNRRGAFTGEETGKGQKMKSIWDHLSPLPLST